MASKAGYSRGVKMTDKDESNTLNEEAGGIVDWDVEAAVEMSFMEAREQAEAEAEERELKELKELITKFHQERSNKNDQ